jgi:hypothetical protein
MHCLHRDAEGTLQSLVATYLDHTNQYEDSCNI